MTDTTNSRVGAARRMLSKVPEVTAWFWVIKILCTTVGESFADWINMTLGVGLMATALIFTVVLAAVLACQLRLNRYVPFVYWLCVVVLSVTGTLYTDILTDKLSVPLAFSTGVFAAALAVVFAIWFARERTLSIHSIVTMPRELYYWLAVLVTFALGTAAGDWTVSATGWGPGTSVLLPGGLIVAIVLGRWLGANAVLSFWLAYILTRPLGANLGDWFASPTADHGLGLGTAWTSVIFLAAILSTVLYLTRSRADVITDRQVSRPAKHNPTRERIMLGYFAAVAAVVAVLLAVAADRPHTASSDEEAATAPVAAVSSTPAAATAHFPPTEVARFRTIVSDTLALVRTGHQDQATARIKDLETRWDQDQATLQPLDQSGWTALDHTIDAALKALRADHPDPTTETRALTALLTALA